MKQLILLILIITTFFSCTTNKENTCGQAYIGGEIVNPNSDYLILYNSSVPVDTIYLNKENRFSYKIENLSSGLYSFVHGSEHQVLLIEPNDSILIRLNTLYFDESLVFSGKGSKKNNYLINLFITLEKEDNIIYRFSKLKPELFEAKLDSMRFKNKASLTAFIEKHHRSNLFIKASKASIDYNYYANKELYPFRYFGNYKLINYSSLPKDFYSYRQTINYNDENLEDFYFYYNFLFPHFNNLALNKYFETTNDSVFNRNSIHYNLNKLELINSLVISKLIKNHLLKYTTRNFLSSSFEDAELMYNSYIDKNTNEKHSKYITSLYNSLKKLQSGNKFPEVEIINHKNETATINTIISKPTVIYFWTSAIKNHFWSGHEKANTLRKKYPNIDFIAININAHSPYIWKRLLKENECTMEHEYRFRDPKAAKKILAINYINKVMVINRDKTIITSNTNMFSKKFKHLLDQIK